MLDNLSPFRLKFRNPKKLNFFQFFLRRYGLGVFFSYWLCKFTGIHPFLRLFVLLNQNYDSFYSNYYILKRIKFFFVNFKYYLDYFVLKYKINNIKVLKSINCLKGRNHFNALPVRGQRRRTNASTKKRIKY